MEKEKIKQLIQWDKEIEKVIINGSDINDEEDLKKGIEELLFEINKDLKK